MRDIEQLLEAVTALEATFRQSAQLGNENFAENRKEAVQLRRVFAEHLAKILSLGAAAFEGSDLHETFRSEFSKMRATLAYHHASWPIIAIDLENADYLASAKALRESNARFIAWVRAAAAKAR